MLAKAGLLGHERIEAQAALPPANAVINSVTRHSSFFSTLSLSNTHTHLSLSPHSPCTSSGGIKFSKIMRWSMRTRGGREEEAGEEMGGLGEVRERGTVISTHPYTPPSLTSSPAVLNQTWQLFNFPKAKSNLQPSPPHWHTVTLERLSHHPPLAADWHHHTYFPPALRHRRTHRYTKSSMGQERQIEGKKRKKIKLLFKWVEGTSDGIKKNYLCQSSPQ